MPMLRSSKPLLARLWSAGNSGWEGKQDSIECKICVESAIALLLTFDLRQQYRHCAQTPRQRREFPNVQPGSQIFNLKRDALLT